MVNGLVVMALAQSLESSPLAMCSSHYYHGEDSYAMKPCGTRTHFGAALAGHGHGLHGLRRGPINIPIIAASAGFLWSLQYSLWVSAWARRDQRPLRPTNELL